MQKNASLLAIVAVDTAENEPARFLSAATRAQANAADLCKSSSADETPTNSYAKTTGKAGEK